jgi:hypothetical protein
MKASDLQLADIGIGRSDIHDVIYGSAEDARTIDTNTQPGARPN